ncbi:arylsulfatase [Anseongella ginsenosidimutans]|nr:arylsulfatase [Anseongella ginsenosidimutans]
MKPGKLIFLIAFAIIFIFSAGCNSLQQRKAEESPPNIIFIMADDLGYGDLGCYGQELIRTPYLDKMAQEGMRFTRFYAGTTVCAPSRSSLLTGQHTGHTPIRGNKEIQPEGQWPLPDSAVTIAEVLKRAGYVTGNFGKWGLGFVGSPGDPLNQGFDTFFGYNCQRQSHNYYPDHLWRDTQRVEYPNSATEPVEYVVQDIHDEALGFISENKDEPFFLYLSYTLPHAALQTAPSDTIFESYKKKFGEEPQRVPDEWNGKGYAPQAYPKAAYAAMVSRLDRYVGQVLSQLRELGLDKNTLVIFTSDNGPHREGGNDPSFFNSNGGFRGIKRDLYEGGIRVPMIAWWPGRIKAGSVNKQAGAFWDFLPTFASLSGAELPEEQTDGLSLAPALFGNTAEQQQHSYLYWEFHEGGGKQAVSMDHWKGVRLNVNKGLETPIELYDLETDPGETNNIAEDHPEIVSRIAAIMEEAHTPSPDFPFGADQDR